METPEYDELTSKIFDVERAIESKLIAKDQRVYTVVALVNAALSGVNIKEDALEKASQVDGLRPLLERAIDIAAQDPSPEKIQNIHVTFGPDATREDAIRIVGEMLDPNSDIRQNTSPLKFNDSRWID